MRDFGRIRESKGVRKREEEVFVEKKKKKRSYEECEEMREMKRMKKKKKRLVTTRKNEKTGTHLIAELRVV